MAGDAVGDALRDWAIAAVQAALREDVIELDGAEERLERIYAATTRAEVYAAISGLPHPPAPLDLSRKWKH